jgi:uncharacterized membrane protein YjjB (DUF3815 family)
MDLKFLLHQTVFGGLAAMGFGILFNMGLRKLPWCGLAGGLALLIRTATMAQGWSIEAASFLAALAVGTVVLFLQERIGVSRNTLDVAGCIPMVPGVFAAKAILGLFALTAQAPQAADQTLILAVENLLRVTFTIGALGTGVAIPTMLTRVKIANRPSA